MDTEPDKPELDEEELPSQYEALRPLKSPHGRWGDQLKERFSLSLQAEQRLHRHFIEKIPGLSRVGRFVVAWLVLMGLLSSGLLVQIQALTPYFTTWQPVVGGVYTEGLLGRATNFNPIYATTVVDRSVANLVFASPYRYNQNNQLEPVLAQSLSVDDKAQQYTLTFRRGLKWQDGREITIDDLIFTIETIQNPTAQSPLRSNWQGVNMDRVDAYTVIFTLQASFSPFPANLTLNILPAHLLKSVPTDRLRTHDFNYRPVGAGPFTFKNLVSLGRARADTQELRIELQPNPRWSDIADSKENGFLQELHLLITTDQKHLTQLFNRGHISGSFNLLPEDITLSGDDYRVVNLASMNAIYLFFKNSSPFCDTLTMRQALTSALDIAAILEKLPGSAHRIFGPLLPEHQGYGPSIRPPVHDRRRAADLLQRAGWQRTGDGWYRDGQKLSLALTTQRDTPYELLAEEVRRQLAELQIDVSLDLRSSENISLDILQNHNYGDLLIYGLNLGSDADVYSYWHSSQIDSTSTLRLNLSEYRSELADEALAAGRSRADADLRRKRYRDFQQVWAADLPALPLYRLQFRYYTLTGVQGPFEGSVLVNLSDRFYDVRRWSVLRQRQAIEDL